MKLDLIHWLSELQDRSLLEKLQAFKEQHITRQGTKSDWWQEISKEEKAEIEKGLEDVKQGRVFTHEEVLAHIDNRFSQLLK